MMKPDNPQKYYRPGTMLGNLKGWEKDMEDRETGRLPMLDEEGSHKFKSSEGNAMNPIAQMLAAAVAPQAAPGPGAGGGPPPGLAPPAIPPVGPPDLRARTRLPSELVPPTYEGTTLSPATENGDYAPLIDPARSRFAAGLLERFGLGAARR